MFVHPTRDDLFTLNENETQTRRKRDAGAQHIHKLIKATVPHRFLQLFFPFFLFLQTLHQERPSVQIPRLTSRQEGDDFHVARQLRLLVVPVLDDLGRGVQREDGLHQGDATWQHVQAVLEARDHSEEALARPPRSPQQVRVLVLIGGLPRQRAGVNGLRPHFWPKNQRLAALQVRAFS